MHEMAVVRSIVDSISEHAERMGAARVASVTLNVGAARDFHEPLLQRYFDYFSRGTVAEGVKVDMVVIPLTYQCEECGAVYGYDIASERITALDRDEAESPAVGEPRCLRHPGAAIRMLSGTELFIEEIGVI